MNQLGWIGIVLAVAVGLYSLNLSEKVAEQKGTIYDCALTIASANSRIEAQNREIRSVKNAGPGYATILNEAMLLQEQYPVDNPCL